MPEPSRIKIGAGRLVAVVAALLGSAIVLVAVASLLVRLALPLAGLFQDRIVAALGRALDAEVSATAIEARLRGFSPRLTLRDLTLSDRSTGERLLGLRELRLDLDLSASLRERAPRVEGVTLVGADIEAVRGADGRVTLRGLDALRGDDRAALAFFLRRGRVSLADSRFAWTDHDPAVGTLRVRIERLDLINRGRRHRLRVDASPAGEAPGTLSIRADLTGSPWRIGEWSGTGYMRFRGQDLAGLLGDRAPGGLALSGAAADIESWVALGGGAPETLSVRLAVADARLSSDGQARPVALGDLRGTAQWRAAPAGWRLDLADWSLAGYPVPAAHLALRRRLIRVDTGEEPVEGAPARLTGTVPEMPLGLLEIALRLAAAVADPGPLPPFQLSGIGRDLSYRIDIEPGGAISDWALQGAVEALRIDQCLPAVAVALPDRPGVERADRSVADRPGTAMGCTHSRTRLDGLDLLFEAGPEGGLLGLDGRDLVVDATPVLGGVLELDRLAGDLQWRLDGIGTVDVWGDGLIANTGDIDTESRFRVQMYTFGASPVLQLQTQLRNGRPGNYDQMATYLPVAVIDDGLEAWLERAVQAGTLTSGELSLHGRLRDFPLDCSEHNPEQHFELSLNIAGGTLDYWPGREPSGLDDAGGGEASQQRLGWPPLRDIDGVIRFDGRSFVIEADRARLLDSELSSGSARIEDLWRPDTLTLEAAGSGPLSDGRRLLTESPLSRDLSGISEAFDVEGRAGLELALRIPLKRRAQGEARERIGYDGALALDGTPALRHRSLGLSVESLDGELRFDNGGVSAVGVKGRIDGEPVQMTLQSDNGAGRTRFEIAGRSTVKDLARRFPSPLWNIADGRTDWRATVALDNADLRRAAPPLQARLESDLRGLALSPPPPIGKPADATRPLRLSTVLAGPGPTELSVEYGPIEALVELGGGAPGAVPPLTRAAVGIGAQAPALPERGGLIIGGGLDELDLGPWLAWGRDLKDMLGRDGSPAGRGLPVGIDLLPSRVQIGALRLGPVALTGVDLRVAPQSGPGSATSRAADRGWSFAFNAAETNGSVELPAPGSGGAIRLQLERFDLEALAPQAGATPDEAAQARNGPDEVGTDPRTIDRFVLSVESLQRGDEALGRLTFAALPTQDGVAFADLRLDGPLLFAEGSGRWTIDATDHVETVLDLSVHSEDLGQLLQRLDYSSDVQEAPADAELSLSWPGGPERFSLEGVRGLLRVDLGAGRLLAVDPGVGRVLGLVNLSALARRLSLDFTDVTDPGFGFDTISGRIRLANGQARIDDLELKSSTADMRIRGTADLVRKAVDQTVWVTPKVGSGVAIAGALAGGPLVGAAVLLADKVSGGGVDRVGRQEYKVSGPWADPTIERVPLLSGVTSSASRNGGRTRNGGAGAPRTVPERSPAGDADSQASPASNRERPEPGGDSDNPFLEGF